MDKKTLNNIINSDIIDYMYNSVVITTAELEGPDHPQILYVNKSFEKLTGYTKDEVIGKTPRILQGEKTNKETTKRLKENLRNNMFFEGSTINYKKDGSTYYLEWNITPIFDTNGKAKYFLGIQKDITDSVNYKKQLEQKNKENLRRIKLQEEFIQEQSKQAAMGEMIDAIAHQWLNPLTKIRMKEQMIQFFLNEKDFHDEEVEHYLEDAINLTYHMEETLQEFRSFLRPNKTKEIVSLNSLVESVLILLKDDLVHNHIEVETRIDENLTINVNKNEFKHVLINFISNSKDAFGQNDINDRKITFESINNTDSIVLKFFDNAGGIPDNIIDTIFEQHVTSKKDMGGTGIGLYMTKQILDKHNINVSVENIPNGACFSLTLPKERER